MSAPGSSIPRRRQAASDIPRLKIHWGGAETTPGVWHLGLFGRYERKAGGGRRRRGWVISVRGVLCWIGFAAACAYFVGAGYVWQTQARRPHNQVTYGDVLLYPLRKDEILLKRGRAMIAEGRDALNAGDSRTGFMLLRGGLQRYPHDLEARLLVVRFFLSARVRTHAQTFLIEGLDHGWPGRDYLETALGIVATSEDFELAIEMCDRALVLHDPARHPEEDRRWLHAQRVRATLSARENAAVLPYLDAHAAEIDPAFAQETRLLALFALGRQADALTLIESWRAADGDTPQVLRLAARTYRENQQLEKMDAALEALRRLAPADPRTRVYAIVQTLLAGRESEGRALVDDYIFRFGGVVRNFTLLAEPLGEIGRLHELDTVVAAAAERGFRPPEFGMIRLRALIDARRWAEARAQIAALRDGPKTDDATLMNTMLDYYEAMLVALQDPARGAQSSFVNKVRLLQLSLPLYRQAIDLLRAEGRAESARQIVTYAEGVFPANPYLERNRRELDAKLAAAAFAAAPVEAASNTINATPASFFAALAATGGASNPAVGLALIRDLRRERPDWLAGEEQAINRAELTLRAAGDDLVALQSVARVYLNGDISRSRAVTSLAIELHGKGDAEKARLLLDEVLRRTPGDEQAARVRDEFFPPAEITP